MRRSAPCGISDEDLKTAFAAATASQKKEFEAAAPSGLKKEPALRVGKKYTAGDLHAWLKQKRAVKNDDGRSGRRHSW